MKVSKKLAKVNANEQLIIAFDVSKDKLDLYTEYGQGVVTSIEDSFANQSPLIETKLDELAALAATNGFNGLHIVCEATASYELKLMKTARRLGHTTAYVSGESVSKFKVVESNDTGKTDRKDPRIIFLLAKNGKVLTYRELQGEYLLLREWNRIYDVQETAKISLKAHIHFLFQRLFCDYSFKKDFPYQATGRGLMELYGFNPYRIVEAGFERFSEQMRQRVNTIRRQTLQRLWRDAESSVLHQLPREYAALMEKHLRLAWEEYLLRENRMKEAKEQMIKLYQRLRDRGEVVPQPQPDVITAFRIARLLGETGPLRDFRHYRVLWRYAGLNLRERKSGKYLGKIRLSKKGRSPIRNVACQAIFGLLRRGHLYGDFYHRKKAAGMPGTKAMVVVIRKFLKMFWALGQPAKCFDQQRVFICESQYRLKMAA